MKTHLRSMITDVMAASDARGGLLIRVSSGVAQDGQLEGLNTSTVKLALKLGGRMVCFRTNSSGKRVCVHSAEYKFPRTESGYCPNERTRVPDDDYKVILTVLEIIDLIKESDAILASEHTRVDELRAPIRAAQEQGVHHLVASHATFVIGTDPKRCKARLLFDVKLEDRYRMYYDLSLYSHWKLDALLGHMKTLCIGSTMVGSDLSLVAISTQLSRTRRSCRAYLISTSTRKGIRTMISRTLRACSTSEQTTLLAERPVISMFLKLPGTQIIDKLPRLNRGCLNHFFDAGAVGFELSKLSSQADTQRLGEVTCNSSQWSHRLSKEQPGKQYDRMPRDERLRTASAYTLRVGRLRTDGHDDALNHAFGPTNSAFTSMMDLSVSAARSENARHPAILKQVAFIKGASQSRRVLLRTLAISATTARAAIAWGYHYRAIASGPANFSDGVEHIVAALGELVQGHHG